MSRLVHPLFSGCVLTERQVEQVGYELAAFVGCEETLREVIGEYKHGYVATLSQGLSLVPVTEQFYDEVSLNDQERTADSYPDFEYLSSSLEKLAQRMSLLSPVAYVEASYFGGIGGQISIVWQNGSVILEPVGERNSEGDMISQGAINAALRILGVQRAESDEFEALGLGRHRHIEDWTPTVHRNNHEPY